MKRGLYSDYKSQENGDKSPIIRRNFATSLFEFIAKFFSFVMHIIVIILASVGLTTLLNKALREMLIEIIQNIN